MTKEVSFQPEIPSANFSRGLYQVEIPELGKPQRGKVRDNWVVKKGEKTFRLMVTTDRQSAFVRTVCTVPYKGQISNLTSKFWFEHTKDIIPNHVVAVPGPNILIAKHAKAVLPVEVVVRRHMAGTSPTSLHYNYFHLGRREIYGIQFPDGLRPNQELPMGTIITPTTKAEDGHDQELTDFQARERVDGKLGDQIWEKVKFATVAIFERARKLCEENGLVLIDTKMEFGIDEDGTLMLIDEVLTPECSRYRLAGESLERSIDKDILIRWLANHGFTGQGLVPSIPAEIIDQMTEMYTLPYQKITGNTLFPLADSRLVRELALDELNLF